MTGRATQGRAIPTRVLENKLLAQGYQVIVGLDEVGRGAWAGPLCVGAAVLDPERRVNGVRDSKQLSEPRREQLFDRIADWCTAWSIGLASHRECDELGMSAAQRLAARRALDGLGVLPDMVLMDGNWDFVSAEPTQTALHTKTVLPTQTLPTQTALPTQTIVKGDTTVLSIAAASILAKVSRDRIMRAQAEDFPGFDFDRNKGYPCSRHQLALKGYGPTPIHRRSWSFMESIPWLASRSQPVTGR